MEGRGEGRREGGRLEIVTGGGEGSGGERRGGEGGGGRLEIVIGGGEGSGEEEREGKRRRGERRGRGEGRGGFLISGLFIDFPSVSSLV